MKKKEFMSEVKGMSLDELQERARQLAEEMMKLRFRKAVSQLEQTHHLRETRRNLARVNTLISSKRAEAAGIEEQSA